MSMSDQQALRRRLKQLRRAIDPQTAAHNQQQVLERLRRHPWLLRARRVAAYVGNQGEIDPIPLLGLPELREKKLYLPVLHPFRPGRLWFGRWRAGERLAPNRYGIPEPVRRGQQLRTARSLDLVIVPLLGFDQRCHRLGMGGGFYDRTFAFRNRHPQIRRPRLLGLAHSEQMIDELDRQPWDVQLDAVITPATVYYR